MFPDTFLKSQVLEMLFLLVLHTHHVGGLFNSKLYHHPYKSIICTSLWHLMVPYCPKLSQRLTNFSSVPHTLYKCTSFHLLFTLKIFLSSESYYSIWGEFVLNETDLSTCLRIMSLDITTNSIWFSYASLTGGYSVMQTITVCGRIQTVI